MTDSARRGQGSKGFLSWSQLLGREATALPSKKRRRRSTIASRRQRALEGLERRVLLSATPTSITVSASASSAVYGQAVNLTADVSASPSEGNVSFFDNGALLATAQPVTSGIARLDNIQLAAETHSITASYSDTAGTFAASSTTVGPNSTTTTVAGNGAFGFSGDGGPATAAELGTPKGLAFDLSGDLFIADYDKNVIREVDHATGVITTVAGNGTKGFSGDGGPATAAELASPTGVE